jgi:hypothetical protein
MEKEDIRLALHPEQVSEEENAKRMRKWGPIFKVGITVVLVLFLAGMFSMCSAPKKLDGPARACLRDNICVDLILAVSEAELETGFSNYSSVPSGKGMLFIFGSPKVQAMWMKDMNFPIDILWLGKKGKILHMEKNVLPCESVQCEIFEPNVEASYVLELAAGSSIEANLYIGNTVSLQNLPDLRYLKK